MVQGEAGGIDLAMVLSDGSDDHLYLSLGNSDADTGWSDDPSWLACPFNPDFQRDARYPADRQRAHQRRFRRPL
ncbi:hypothetical protein LP419_09595 [Massilia sp. H-1]|nr:hypothetical protein LP419_09595 [Massilia sp. H-1]